MSTLFGFVVGYVVGARAGGEGFSRLERAFRDVRDSDEFRNFLQVLKNHALGTVQTVNDRLQNDDVAVAHDMESLADRAKARLRAALED